MKKKHDWNIKSKHILVVMILVCISLMLLTFASKISGRTGQKTLPATQSYHSRTHQ